MEIWRTRGSEVEYYQGIRCILGVIMKKKTTLIERNLNTELKNLKKNIVSSIEKLMDYI